MDDHFLHVLRAEPPADFARRLRDRLARQDREATLERARTPRRLASIAAACVTAVAVFAFPSVRASAQAFLNLFRVVNFTAVPVNADRIRQLNQNGLDLPSLIGNQVEVLEDPGPVRTFASLADAAAAAGVQPRVPMLLPPGVAPLRTEVAGEHAARVTADTGKLVAVLDTLGITDIRPPADLDGQIASVRVHPVLRTVYASGNLEISFVQAQSPEVTLPSAVDLSVIGEIGLRIAGLDPSQARTLAQAIDWRNTLIVPVPAGVSSFRQVAVHGSRGLLLTMKQKREVRSLLWSENGFVYGVAGPLNEGLIMQIADSVK